MYTINERNELVALTETPYPKEIDLQQLLIDHPALLSGHQMNLDVPRHFLLITSEAGIAIAEHGGDVFSLDLLYVDQDAVPTLVEVKRSGDTRLRREVIAQLLEYAANVCAFGKAERFRGEYEKTCARQGHEPEAFLNDTLQLLDSVSYQQFWESVQANLLEGRLRLILVADVISAETLRVIEYLQRQMPLTDVFAVVVPQYTGGSTRALGPRVLNPSVSKRDPAAPVKATPEWTESAFYSELSRIHGPDAVRVFRQITTWCTSKEHLQIYFGNGKKDGSIIFTFTPGHDGRYKSGRDVAFLTLWTYGRAEIGFQYLSTYGAFRTPELREELRTKLSGIPSVDIPSDKIDKRPSIEWSALASPEAIGRFLETLEWLVGTLGVDRDVAAV